MLFMIVEYFRDGDPKPAYRRIRERGRMLPDGVSYEGSWIDVELKRCFQLMSTDDATKLQEWVANWNEVVEFEIHAVAESKDTTAMINRLIDEEDGASG